MFRVPVLKFYKCRVNRFANFSVKVDEYGYYAGQVTVVLTFIHRGSVCVPGLVPGSNMPS